MPSWWLCLPSNFSPLRKQIVFTSFWAGVKNGLFSQIKKCGLWAPACPGQRIRLMRKNGSAASQCFWETPGNWESISQAKHPLLLLSTSSKNVAVYRFLSKLVKCLKGVWGRNSSWHTYGLLLPYWASYSDLRTGVFFFGGGGQVAVLWSQVPHGCFLCKQLLYRSTGVLCSGEKQFNREQKNKVLNKHCSQGLGYTQYSCKQEWALF